MRVSTALPLVCFASAGPQGFAPPPGGFAPGPYGPGPAGSGFGYGPPTGPIRQTHTLAIVALIAGILGFFGCPALGPAVAIITGVMARNEIRSQPERWEGNGLALAGIVLGAIHLGLTVIVVLMYLLMIAGVFSLAILGGH